MKFCRNMYLDNRTNSIDFQGHRLKVKVAWVFFLCAWCCSYPRTVLSLEQGLMTSLCCNKNHTSWGRVEAQRSRRQLNKMWTVPDSAMLPLVLEYVAAPLSDEKTASVSDARPSLRTASRITPTPWSNSRTASPYLSIRSVAKAISVTVCSA